MEEQIDTFTEQMLPTGVATRTEAHRLGLWHRTFHCWMLHLNVDGEYLVLQRRHASKDTNPNKLDVSCAGHLSAGEQPSDGVREIREELGIDVGAHEMRRIGIFKCSNVYGQLKDNEFRHVFVMSHRNQSLKMYRPAFGEVSGLYLIRLDDMVNLCRNLVQSVSVSGYEFTDTLKLEWQTIYITQEDLVYHDSEYLESLFQFLESHLN